MIVANDTGCEKSSVERISHPLHGQFDSNVCVSLQFMRILPLTLPQMYSDAFNDTINPNFVSMNIRRGSECSSIASDADNEITFVYSTMDTIQQQLDASLNFPRKKRSRASPEQLEKLNNAFELNSMPTASNRIELSKEVGMSPRAIQVWFQNRRAKAKNEVKRRVDEKSGLSLLLFAPHPSVYFHVDCLIG